MIVISRGVGDAIQIGPDIVVRVIRKEGQRVRIAIEAPGRNVRRGELEPRAVAPVSVGDERVDG